MAKILHHSPQASSSVFILGIDMGTSGIRGVIVERSPCALKDKIWHSESVPLNTQPIEDTIQQPKCWITSLNTLLNKISQAFDLKKISHIIIDATSSSVLLSTSQGRALTHALMYNNQQADQEALKIQTSEGFDPESPAQGASSTLAKALYLINQINLLQQRKISSPPIICHQIDFLNHYLCGSLNITDENSALKLGYNAQTQQWPNWIKQLLAPVVLPKVVAPGTPLGNITTQLATQYGFSPSLTVHAGTTDSIAGFLASGASQMGDTVISLGSTLAIKIITSKPLFNQKYGIYSHKLKNNWLVGGASNAGGAVLLNAYSLPEIKYLIKSLDPLSTHDLNITDRYYPLNSTGERFPISDIHFRPTMPIKPKQPLVLNASLPEELAILKAHQTYFLNLIKGLVHIEELAYKKLFQETQHPINHLYSVGGGVKNRLWQQCRKAHFTNQTAPYLTPQTTLKKAYSLDAAYGVTKLI